MTSIKNQIYFAINFIMLVTNTLLPDFPHIWLFSSKYGFTENSKYLYLHCQDRCPDIRNVWIARSKPVAKQLQQDGYEACYKWSAKSILLHNLAKFSFRTHAKNTTQLWGPFVGKSVTVFLGHGEGNVTSPRSRQPTPDSRVVTESYRDGVVIFYSQKHLSESQRLLEGQFKFATPAITGFPKHDALFRHEPHYDSATISRVYRDELTRWILYIPSRLENAGEDFQDYLPMDDLETLDSILERHRAELLIKPHPADKPFLSGSQLENVSFLDSRDDIYPILPKLSLLIADFSSTIFAAAHAEIPIVFYFPEWHGYDVHDQLETLVTRRGSTLRPDLFDLFDAPVTTSPDQLRVAIERHLNPASGSIPPVNGDCKEYVDFTDGNSCARVVDLIKTL